MSESTEFTGNLDELNLDELEPIIDHVTDNRKWKFKHSDLLGQEFVILGYAPITTTFGEAVLADCLVDGERVPVLLGGTVLIEQVKEAYKGQPMRAKIGKVGRAYSFIR